MNKLVEFLGKLVIAILTMLIIFSCTSIAVEMFKTHGGFWNLIGVLAIIVSIAVTFIMMQRKGDYIKLPAWVDMAVLALGFVSIVWYSIYLYKDGIIGLAIFMDIFALISAFVFYKKLRSERFNR